MRYVDVTNNRLTNVRESTSGEVPLWLLWITFALGLLWIFGIGSVIAIIVGGYSISVSRRAGCRPRFVAKATIVVGILGLLLTLVSCIVVVVSEELPSDGSSRGGRLLAEGP